VQALSIFFGFVGMSGTTFITSIDDEITVQDQRNSNESSIPPHVVSAVRSMRRKVASDVELPQNLNSLGSDVAKLKRLATSEKPPQFKLALQKKPSLDLGKMDLHEAIRGSIKNLNNAIPLGIHLSYSTCYRSLV
jgi:hypothetical protein